MKVTIKVKQPVQKSVTVERSMRCQLLFLSGTLEGFKTLI